MKIANIIKNKANLTKKEKEHHPKNNPNNKK